MNPGKIVDPYPIVENLRLAGPAGLPRLATVFRFPRRRRRVSRAPCCAVSAWASAARPTAERCARATWRRARRSTRRAAARACSSRCCAARRSRGGWKSEEVRERARPVPRVQGLQVGLPRRRGHGDVQGGVSLALLEGSAAAALGLCVRPHPPGGRALPRPPPGLVNFMTQTPGLSSLARAAAGIAPERPIPALARQTFRTWFRRRAALRGPGSRRRVLLLPDTFNNFFQPEPRGRPSKCSKRRGFGVTIPGERPLLRPAALRLRDARSGPQHLQGGPRGPPGRPPRAASPWSSWSPPAPPSSATSCRTSFPTTRTPCGSPRQTHLLRSVPRARRRRTSCRRGDPAPALVQAHCHQQALMGSADDQKLLGRLGLDVAPARLGLLRHGGRLRIRARRAPRDLDPVRRARSWRPRSAAPRPTR